jgi:acetyl esterase/lipase
VKALLDQAYVTDGHERQKLDLYLPQKSEGPFPLVVWIHGGAWRGGDKSGCPALPLTGRSYAVASLNYRLSRHAVFPAQIEDCRAAIRWLRGKAKEFNLDPERIGVWGGSAGGHLVSLLGTTGDKKEWDSVGDFRDQSAAVQCVLNWYGPSDFRDIGDSLPDQSPVTLLLGGQVKDHRELAAAASPLAHVHAKCPPFLIVHGTKDPIVKVGHSQRLAESLKAKECDVTLTLLEGAGHGGPQFTDATQREAIAEFFDRHLVGEKK